MAKGKTETIDMFGVENAQTILKRETMAKAAMDGCSCPTCGQFVKVYNRTITSTMARQLIHAWRCHGAGKWFHTRDVVMDSSGAGDFSKLEFWGLIEKSKAKPEDDFKRTSGLWRVTDKGAAFIAGDLSLPRHAAIYNNKLLDFIGPDEGIKEALGNRFNYRELMGWAKKPVEAASMAAGRDEGARV